MDSEKINDLYWSLLQKKALEEDYSCSLVSEWNGMCCWQHDLHYRSGRYWKLKLHWFDDGSFTADIVPAGCITRKDADATFWQCMRQRTVWWARPRAFARWLGVRIAAWRTWNRYRKEDGIECPGGK